MRGLGKITQADISWTGPRSSRKARKQKDVSQFWTKYGRQNSIITTISRSIVYPKHEKTFTCSLPSDSKPWRVGDMAVLQDGRLLVLDVTNNRVKLFDHCQDYVTSKIIEENCHSITLVSKNKFSVMNSCAIYTFTVDGNRVCLDDKLELTGMHYGLISNQTCICLVKLVSMTICDQNFRRRSTLNYKSVSGGSPYTPRYIAVSPAGSYLCYNEIDNALINFDENGKRLWGIGDIPKCYGVESAWDNWIYISDTEIVLINGKGQKVGKLLGTEYEAECIKVSRESKKLFISDRKNIYVYNWDMCSKQRV